MNYFIRKIILPLIFLMIFACDGFIDLEDPNRYTEDSYFIDLDRTEEAVVATYTALYFGGLFVQEYYFLHDLMGHESTDAPPMAGVAQWITMANYVHGPENFDIGRLWTSLYRIILRANFVEDRVANLQINSQDQARANLQIAQAKFLKAWAYYELVTSWGDVPLRKTFTDHSITQLPRAPRSEVWQYIEDELNVAINFLPEQWDTENTGRITKGAAIALLGTAHMFQQDWANALLEFEKLESMAYDLTDNFTDNFDEVNENNIESIFEIQFADNPDGFTWYMFGGPGNAGAYENVIGVPVPPNGATHNARHMQFAFNAWGNPKIDEDVTLKFIYADENGQNYIDPRAELSFYGDSQIGDTLYCDNCPETNGPVAYPFDIQGYRFKKGTLLEYTRTSPVPRSAHNTRVLRYAEILLSRAECLIELGRIEEALPLINRVRERVNAFLYTDLGSQENARQIIQRERFLELFGEQKRWRDLVRWGIAEETIDAELVGENRDYQAIHDLFPIPSLEIATNFEIVVNNGWN